MNELENFFKNSSENDIGRYVCENFDNHTPFILMYLSCKYNRRNVVEFLLDKEVDINVTDGDSTAICHVNDLDMAIFLVDNKAKISDIGYDEVNPLYTCSSVEVAKYLIEQKADPCYGDVSGITPLHCCEYVEVSKLLIEKGADVNKLDVKNRTPLHYQRFNVDIVELLLKNGADPNIKDDTDEENTILHDTDLPEVIELLIEYKVDVNARNYSDEPPLFHASNAGVAKALIKGKADIHFKNEYGYTALHRCVEDDAIRVILEHNADIDVEDEDGKTPVDVLGVDFFEELITDKVNFKITEKLISKLDEEFVRENSEHIQNNFDDKTIQKHF